MKDKSKDFGKLWWKYRWFSFCSRHQIYDKDCNICQSGAWTNVWKWRIGGLIYDIFPKFWIWYVNRK